MTSGPAQRVTTGRGGNSLAVDPSPAALAANAMLEELRRTAGIVTRPPGAGLDQDQGAAASTARPSPALAGQGQARLEALRLEYGVNYRRPGAVEAAAWSAWAAERSAGDDLDQGGAGLDHGDALDQVGGHLEPGHVAGSGCVQPPLDLFYGAGTTLLGLPGDDLDGAALDQGAPGRAKVGHIAVGHAAASTGRPLPFPEDDHGGRVDGAALDGRAVKCHPSLAAAFLASTHVAPVGRLWLLLQAWDAAGRGCYTLDQVYRAFSVEGSAWRVADRRRVQQLIKHGAGIFWTLRDYHGGRYHGLQMTGPAGVAAALDLDRLAGRPVAVPVADLLGGMHSTNAALFAAVVTLRRRGRRGPRPVSRRTLAGMTGRAASTQRTYSKTARIKARRNYVYLDSGDVDAPGVFLLRAGRARLARHMPNSYVVPLAAASRGRQRKINRRLNLVITEARGYRPEVEYQRIYHDTAGQAAARYGRNYHHDHYWPAGQTAAGAGLWHMVEAV